MIRRQVENMAKLAFGVIAAAALSATPLAAQTVATARSAEEPPAGPRSSVPAPVHPALVPARTRFVIGLEHATQFQVFSLSNPNRVIVELPAVKLRLPPEPSGAPVGLVKSFRCGLSAPGQSRVVIEMAAPAVVENARIEKSKDGKSHNLAIDIVPVTAPPSPQKPLKRAPFGLGAAGVQPPMPKPAVRPEVRAAAAYKPLIVIDPGHGGHDSGATKNGIVEKDAVLAFGLKLRDKLLATGQYRVLMTRDKDVFVPLGERTAFAERNGARLFIAVHADYAGSNSRARGATIYSLRPSVADALKRSALDGAANDVLPGDQAMAVRKAGGDIDTVKGFLSYLAGLSLEPTREDTNLFSRTVIETMEDSTVMRSEPEQQASFRVLKTAQFPSVLIELAYVTNKEDAELLKSDAWRNRVADSIATAVNNFFSHQPDGAAPLARQAVSARAEN